jgi:hypothetical protein
MYKFVASLLSLMTAASAVIVIGVVVYSTARAINESIAPRGQVSVSEIATTPEELPVLADTKEQKSVRSPLPL